jgi:hypothetical protein
VTDRRRDRVYVDANELFPFAMMDVLLALAEDLIIDFVWSDELLDEWERVIVREGKRGPESARSVTTAIRSCFTSGRIDPATYRHDVPETPGPDPDDRVHTAAAIAGRASVLLTKNQSDFPAEHLGKNGVTLTDADTYLRDLIRRRPVDVTTSVRRLAAEKKHPPRTPCDLVDGLRRAGARGFADRLGARLGCPSPRHRTSGHRRRRPAARQRTLQHLRLAPLAPTRSSRPANRSLDGCTSLRRRGDRGGVQCEHGLAAARRCGARVAVAACSACTAQSLHADLARR